MGRLRPLLPYFRPYLGRLVLGVVCVLGAAVVGLMAPLVVGRAVDAFMAEVTRSRLLFFAGLLVAIAIGQGVFSFTQRMTLVSMSRRIEYDLRNDYFAHLETLPPSFFERSATGDLMARGTNDLQAVRMLCGPAIMYSSNTLFTATGALIFMFHIHPRLTLLALCTMPAVAVATKVFGQRIHQHFERVQERFADLSAKAQENLAGVRVVRAYAQEAAEEAAFDRFNRDYVAANRRLIRWSAAFHPLLQVLVGFGFVAVLWYGGSLVVRGGITLGQFVSFNFFLGKLVWPMIAIGWVVNLIQRGAASFGRMRRVLETRPEIRDEPPLVDPPVIHGSLRMRSLDFSYRPSGPRALLGIDLEVPAGATVAVVGRTGAGKSTLLSLVPRLIDPPEETLFVDGIDVRRVPLAKLRGAIAMVPQESFLFSASLLENIRFGRREATRQEILEAAELAGLVPDIERFPRGLETLIGERGITLSGGQKQRVALARALVRRPRILLLDDCLSAVDAETEERILGNLRRVFEGRTVVFSSHRISAVERADQIVVLEDGRIAERGTHVELLALGGLYAELARRQRLEEELAAV